MKRILTISWVGLVAVAAASAASFNINLAQGLSAANVTGGSNTISGTCAGGTQAAAGYGGCIQGTQAAGTGTGNVAWNSVNTYSNNIFNSASSATAGNGNTGSFSPASSYNVTDPYAGTISLALGSTSTVWNGTGGPSGATATLTIPIGVYGVTDVWTMLQDEFGVNGVSNTTVIFNFGSSSNQTSGLTQVSYSLTNGNQIRSSTVCTGTNTGGAAPASCTGFAGTTSSSNTTQVYSQAYAGDGRTGPYLNTQGNIYLDAQVFNLATSYSAATPWLVSIQIQNIGGVYNGTGSTFTSRTALSAITVDTAPEPSSVALFGAGLGALAWFRRRRQA